MSNVPRVNSSGNPLDPSGNDPQVSSDPTKFKELMQVGSSDADQQKKKKHNREAIEEMKAKQSVAGIESPASTKEPNLGKYPKTKKIGASSKAAAASSQQAPLTPTAVTTTSPSRVEKGTLEGTGSSLNTPQSQNYDPVDDEKKEPILPQASVEKFSTTEPEENQKKKDDPSMIAGGPILAENLGPFLLPAASATPPGYASLHPELFALFEKMVSSLVVMEQSGIKETEISLSDQAFSIFAGSKLVIREYSTAPHAFNIELQGLSNESVALFDLNTSKMLGFFQQGKHNFKINRLESSLLSSKRDIVKRKQNSNEEKDESS